MVFIKNLFIFVNFITGVRAVVATPTGGVVTIHSIDYTVYDIDYRL